MVLITVNNLIMTTLYYLEENILLSSFPLTRYDIVKIVSQKCIQENIYS